MNNKLNFPKRKGRKLVVFGVQWKYTIGSSNIVLYSENGEKLYEKIWKVKGVSPDVWERGQWKITSDGMLCPSEIVSWLKSR